MFFLGSCFYIVRNSYHSQPQPNQIQTTHGQAANQDVQTTNQDVPYIPLLPLTNAFEVDYQESSNDIHVRPQQQHTYTNNSVGQLGQQQQGQKKEYYLQQLSVHSLPRSAKKSSRNNMQQQVNASTTGQQVMNKCAERDKLMRSTLQELGQLTQNYDRVSCNLIACQIFNFSPFFRVL